MASWLQQISLESLSKDADPGVVMALTLLVVLITLAIVPRLLAYGGDTGSGSGSSGSSGSTAVRSPTLLLPKEEIKRVYENLRDRELAWLRGLPEATQRRILPSWQPGQGGPFPAHFYLISGEVAMVLMGLKPCVVSDHGNWHEGNWPDGTSFAGELTERVLRPWMAECGLERHGFVLTAVSSPCVPSEVPHHPGFADQLLFYNEKGPDAGFVRSIFRSSHRRLSNTLLGEALGYPGKLGRGHATVTYAAVDDSPFRPPEPEARGEALGPAAVVMLEYEGREDDVEPMGRHYRAVADAFAHVLGLRLALDLGGCAPWSHAALAKLLFHAFPEAFRLVDGSRRVDVSGIKMYSEEGELVSHPWLVDLVEGGDLARFALVLKTLERVKAEKEAEARRWWKT